MGKTLKATCKMCRRESVSLCGKEKCAFKRRPFPPGVHGPTAGKSRLSGFGIQLREKQKAKRLYNIMETQFRNYFAKATKTKGDTGVIMLQLLETRLDNVIYRLGLAKTRRQSRQMVNHGFVEINGKKVDIPSYQCRVGEVVAIREIKQKKGLLNDIDERLKAAQPPSWLTSEAGKLSGKIISIPEGEDLKTVFDPKLIVEFYSRT
ncbi:MAG: 30S ribosomal protein S4 [Patescibacteria group bacterium]